MSKRTFHVRPRYNGDKMVRAKFQVAQVGVVAATGGVVGDPILPGTHRYTHGPTSHELGQITDALYWLVEDIGVIVHTYIGRVDPINDSATVFVDVHCTGTARDEIGANDVFAQAVLRRLEQVSFVDITSFFQWTMAAPPVADTSTVEAIATHYEISRDRYPIKEDTPSLGETPVHSLNDASDLLSHLVRQAQARENK